MMVPNARHFDQTWVVHSLNQGFELEDVWEFPIKAGPQHNLEQFRECFQRVFERLETEGISGFLFRLRFFLGQIFGWDKQPPIRNIMRAGSLRERYVVSGHGHLPDPETGDRLPFEWVYRLPDEYLSEIDNKTCHAALHLGWVPLGEGRYTVRMAVYVKPHGRLGRFYMALIKPFRRWIVYPAMMRLAAREWRKVTEP